MFCTSAVEARYRLPTAAHTFDICNKLITPLMLISLCRMQTVYFLDFLLLPPADEADAASLFLLPALLSDPAAGDLPVLALLADLEAAPEDLAFLRSSFSRSSSSVFSLSIRVMRVLHLLCNSYKSNKTIINQ